MFEPPGKAKAIAWGRKVSRGRVIAIAVLVAVIGALGVVAPAGGTNPTQPYQTYESTVAGNGPVDQYRFDDSVNSTALLDSAGTDNGVNYGISFGGAGPFTGSHSGTFAGKTYAALASYPLSGAASFSAEAWIYWNGSKTHPMQVFDLGSSPSNFMALTPASALTGSPIMFEIRTSSSDFKVTGPVLTANTWEYVAVTEDTSGNLTLYLNGVQVAQTTGVTVNPSSLGVPGNNWIGKSQVSTDPLFNGRLSNLAFYTAALSASQVLAHYNAGAFPVNLSPPAITGPTQVGQTLSALVGSWTAVAPISYSYQWQSCNRGGNTCRNVTGATGPTYLLQSADMGTTLRAVVTGSNSAGSSSATSTPTGVTAAAAPANTAPPSVSGTAQDGQTLSALVGSWTGVAPLSYSYQWQSCNRSGSSCGNVPGATASTYQLHPGDVGTTLKVVVTASNSAGSGSRTSAPSGVVVAAPPASTGLPSVSGTAQDGQTLSASVGSWSGTAPLSYSYQWQSCDPTGNNCANVSGATGSSYQLGPGDVGTTLVVVVTASNSAGSAGATSAPSGVVVAAPPASTGLPSVSGTAQDGQTLSASVGSWSGTAPLSYSYQWQSCDPTGNNCANVSGATGSSYQLGPGDVGTTLQVVVTASNSAGASYAVSAVTPVVGAIPPSDASQPSISGVAQIGQTLSASPGVWSGDPVTSYTYQWQNCDPTGNNCWNIAGATASSYQVPTWTLNETLQVTVTASNSGGSGSGSSPVTQPVGGPTSQAPVYFPSSFFVQPLPANAPLDPQSAEMVQQLTNEAFGVAPTESYDCRQSISTAWNQWNSAEEAYCHQVSARASFSDDDYSPTVYTVPAGQPTVTVQIPNNVNLQAAMQAVPIPPGAFPAAGTDGQMIIYQPSSDTMWQLWRAYQANGQWYASAGGRIQHVSTDPGYYQNVLNTNNSCSTNSQVKYCEQAGWGGSAAGIPLLPGLMTIPQLQSGQIDHAILLALPDNAANVWSWPAQHSDGVGDSIIPEGAWFRINPNVNLDAWFASLGQPVPPIVRIMAQAMQTYGAVVVNRSTSVTVGSENWTPSGNDIFDGAGGLYGGLSPNQFMTELPWEDMQALQRNLCSAIQPGSTLYQTPCNPPQYVTPNPNPPANNSCPPPLSVFPQPGQTNGPSVTITDPTWTYVGSRVPFSAAVTDPSGVTQVDFKIDGQLRFVSNYPICQNYEFGGPYGFWDVESEPTFGWHTLEVDAYDSLGYESSASEMVYGGP